MGLSESSYQEIRELMVKAGYDHAFNKEDDTEVIDMHGIAVTLREPLPVEEQEREGWVKVQKE
jgi:hypothetical protein